MMEVQTPNSSSTPRAFFIPRNKAHNANTHPHHRSPLSQLKSAHPLPLGLTDAENS
jgi:hypothetical protein